MTFPTPLLPMQVPDNRTFAIVPTNNINHYVLVANVAQTITFPLDTNNCQARYIVMSANGDFYARYNGTAQVPAANSADGAGSELNPSAREIQYLTSMSVISPTATVLTISYYA